jgi:hypothetical protein
MIDVLDDKSIRISQCLFCLHYVGNEKCNAFEDKTIPRKIFDGSIAHDSPYVGDHGLRFVKLEGSGGNDR